MGLFDVMTEVQVGGHTLRFRQPDLDQIAKARELTAQFNAASANDAATIECILYNEIPPILFHLLEDAVPASGVELPANWKEEIRNSPYLSGGSGLQILQAVFFRSYVEPAGKTA